MTCDSFAMTMWINIEDLYASYCTTTKYSDWCHWTCMFFFCWPDGLWVDVDRSDPLQQKLHHFQERIGGLFWECQLPSDLPLQGVKTDIFMDTHRLQEVATRLHSNISSTYLTSCSNKLVFSLTHTQTCKTPTNLFTSCRLKTQTHC